MRDEFKALTADAQWRYGRLRRGARSLKDKNLGLAISIDADVEVARLPCRLDRLCSGKTKERWGHEDPPMCQLWVRRVVFSIDPSEAVAMHAFVTGFVCEGSP